MEHGQVSQCKRDTERVRNVASKRQRFLGRFQGAIRVTEMPVAVPDIGMAEDAHVDAVQLGLVAARGASCFQTSLKPITGCLEGANVKCRDSSKVVSLHEQRRFADSTREIDRFGEFLHRLAKIAAHMMNITESPQRREENPCRGRARGSIPGRADRPSQPRSKRSLSWQ